MRKALILAVMALAFLAASCATNTSLEARPPATDLPAAPPPQNSSQPPSNSVTLKRICPDAWYDNQMPGIKVDGSTTQYLIVNGQRAELKDYDMVWIKASCPVNHPEVVY